MIKAVHHAQVSIPVGAEETARAFYCGILGLNEIPKPESIAGRGGFGLSSINLRSILELRMASTASVPSHTSLTWCTISKVGATSSRRTE
jgi:catechol-2,3-dioxygenase